MPKGAQTKDNKEQCSPPSSMRVKWGPSAVAQSGTLKGTQDEKQDGALCALDKQALDRCAPQEELR